MAVHVELVNFPARRFMILRGVAATEYFGFCAEVGCDLQDELAAHPAALGPLTGFWLPAEMRRTGTSEYVMGVEVTVDFEGPIPGTADRLDLPEQSYLLFSCGPFAESAMGEAVGAVQSFADSYDPSSLEVAWDKTAPRWQHGPNPSTGYIEGRPVCRQAKSL